MSGKRQHAMPHLNEVGADGFGGTVCGEAVSAGKVQVRRKEVKYVGCEKRKCPLEGT